jgi:hypothetical protein
VEGPRRGTMSQMPPLLSHPPWGSPYPPPGAHASLQTQLLPVEPRRARPLPSARMTTDAWVRAHHTRS